MPAFLVSHGNRAGKNGTPPDEKPVATWKFPGRALLRQAGRARALLFYPPRSRLIDNYRQKPFGAQPLREVLGMTGIADLATF